MAKNDKLSILDALGKKRGVMSIAKYSTRKTEAIHTGSFSLDLALGVGGWPRGCIIDIFGPESSGKSLLTLMAIAEVQKTGGVAVVLDAERAYTKSTRWLEANGVDPDMCRFIKIDEDGAEKAMETIYQICKAEAADLIVVDSVPALMPKEAITKGLDEGTTLSVRARMLSNALSKLAPAVDDSKVCLMFINQLRAKIGGFNPYGPAEKETGGYALRFFSSIRVSVGRVAKSTRLENKVPMGHRVRVRNVKNKVAKPYRTAEFDIDYGIGVDPISELADMMINTRIASQGGAWIKYGKEKFQGRKGLVDFLQKKGNFSTAEALVRERMSNAQDFGVTEAEVEKGEDGE